MRKTEDERLEDLKRRRAALDAEVNRLQAKKRAEDRKADTRRKILLGAVVMQEIDAQPDKIGVWAKSLLSERLTKPRDRALFGLGQKESNDAI